MLSARKTSHLDTTISTQSPSVPRLVFLTRKCHRTLLPTLCLQIEIVSGFVKGNLILSCFYIILSMSGVLSISKILLLLHLPHYVGSPHENINSWPYFQNLWILRWGNENTPTTEWVKPMYMGRRDVERDTDPSACNMGKIWCPQAQLTPREIVFLCKRKTICTAQSTNLPSMVNLMRTLNRGLHQHRSVHLDHKSHAFWPTHYHPHILRGIFANLFWKNWFSLFSLWFPSWYLL